MFGREIKERRMVVVKTEGRARPASDSRQRTHTSATRQQARVLQRKMTNRKWLGVLGVVGSVFKC